MHVANKKYVLYARFVHKLIFYNIKRNIEANGSNFFLKFRIIKVEMKISEDVTNREFSYYPTKVKEGHW